MKLNLDFSRLRWEFWPTWLIYLPVYPYWLWLSLRSRTFFFFSTANPSMTMGGLWYASKFDQLKHLHPQLIPKTLLFEPEEPIEQVILKLKDADMDFPLIIKPDRLERGRGVQLIKTKEQLKKALSHLPYTYLLQEYIDYQFEAAVFYVRLPNQAAGTITSIATKDFLKIIGDGEQTTAQLLAKQPRAKNQMQRLEVQMGAMWNYIPQKNKEVLIEPIGNHNRGTVFLNAKHLINEKLNVVFDKIAKQMPDFYYGRFDLRCPTLENFKAGKNIKIIEVNGANAEPAHMYDPNFTPLKGWGALLNNWRILFEISRQNMKLGHQATSFIEAKNHWKIKKKVQNASQLSVFKNLYD